ncbi:NfeD family protein [Phenylobacterium sp. J426]|uniref:NfeD family protein n=1 Tax=Phenylobacterium sp. J426 TaxID=2898439 RepID=UPI002151F316|nr:NfeD family protein [Phenylobacterium sp. J426]MCR5873308.1 NfeD family protein [Phenylobacterium sp. J426]
MQTLADLYAAQPFWIWVALAAALIAIEIMTGSGWLLWASASAGAVAIATGLGDLSFAMSILVFALLTIASTLLARRYLPRSVAEGAAAGDINDNIDRLVGRAGSVVRPLGGRDGRVLIDGKEWPAELEGEGVAEAGARVEVTGIQGVRLTVRRA